MKTFGKKEDRNGWKKHEPRKEEEKKTFFPIINGQNPRHPYTQVKEVLFKYMRQSGKYKFNLSLILEMLQEEQEIIGQACAETQARGLVDVPRMSPTLLISVIPHL